MEVLGRIPFLSIFRKFSTQITFMPKTLHTPPMSERTPQVRDAIVAAVPGVNSAEDVTEAHLAGIGQLTLLRKNITALKEGDFDGLTSLVQLSIGSNPFSSLPEGIFSGLTSLTRIDLGGNKISSLPADVFSGLSSLTTLIMPANKLSSLPAGLFTGLSSLRYIYLWDNQLTTLPAGLFTGLSSLTKIHLYRNQISSLSADVFSGLSSLTTITLGSNQLSILPAGLFTGLSSLTTIELGGNQLNNLSAGLFTGLSSLTTIGLGGNQLSNLPTSLFSGLSSLVSISLYRNQLSSLPMGLFSGLSSLTTLSLSDNAAELSLIIELQQIGGNQFKAVIATGAPFTIVVPLNVTNGSIMGGATTATIPIGSVESAPFTVIPTPGTSDAVTLLIGTLPNLPSDHRGYTLAPFNLAPEFVEGPSTTRTVAEDIHTGGYIGTVVSATDPYNDPLTYTLSGADASSFAIDATTGQLRTSIQLDYETRSTYTVTVNVTDGSLTSSITVTINVTDVEPEALNIGEPRTVRLFYLLPNDRPYRPEVVQEMKTGILEVQSFYAEKMAAQGHGNTTFTIETDAQGDPIVHRIDADYGDSQYVKRGYTEGEIARAFDTSIIISVIVMDISSYPIKGRGTGNKSSGWLIMYEDWDWFTAAHELGHAFGLHHDFRDNTDIVSYGNPDRSTATLSACAAEFLSVHPYFDSSIPLEIETRPTVKLVSSITYPTGAESVTIQVRVRDDSGLHQVMLFVRPNNPFRGDTPELKMWQKLDGETDTVVEFNFDGRVPSDSDKTDPETHRTLANTNQHEISVIAVDTEGDWFRSNFTLKAGNVQADIVPVSERTPQVRDAIIAAVPDANSSSDVIAADLAEITSLSLINKNITSLKADDFDGLSALQNLNLSSNSLTTLPEGIFDGLSALIYLYLGNNSLTTLPEGIFDGLSALQTLSLDNNSLTTLPEGMFDGLSALVYLYLGNNSLTTLPEGIFDGLSALQTLSLDNNSLTTLPEDIFDGLSALNTINLRYNYSLNTLPEGIFDGISALRYLYLSYNSLNTLPEGIFDGHTSLIELSLGRPGFSLPLIISLEKVGDDQFKAVAPTGVPFATVLPITVTNGSISGGTTSLTIPAGSVESDTIKVTQTPGTTGAVTVNIGTLPSLPSNHSGYALVKSTDLPITVIVDGSVLTLTVGAGPGAALRGYNQHSAPEWDFGSFSPQSFELNGVSYTMYKLTYSVAGKRLALQTIPHLPGGFALHLDAQQFTSVTALDYNQYTWNNVELDWSDGKTVQIGFITTTPMPPGPPTNLQATPGYEKVTLSWIPPANADSIALPITEYEYRISVDGGNTWDPDWETIGLGRTGHNTLTSCTFGDRNNNSNVDNLIDINLTNGTSYTFEIRARGGDGYSEAARITVVPDGSTPVSERTPQVRDAIVAAVPGVNSASDVTAAHLAAITTLYLSNKGITALKSGDFDGLTALTTIRLWDNELTTLPADIFDGLTTLTALYLRDNAFTTLPADIFDGLTTLTTLYLSNNAFTTLPADIFDGLTALDSLALYANAFTTLPADIFDGLTALDSLYLYANELTTLPADIFDGLTALTTLHLGSNAFTTLPAGIFEGLTGLTTLALGGNAVDPLPLTVSLKKVADGQFKAVAPTGAPFDIVLPISVTNGSISGGTTTLTIPAGSVESEPLTITRTLGATYATTVNIGTLPSLPANHSGYTLVKSVDLPLTFTELGGQVLTSVGSRTPQVAEAILGVVRLNDPNVSSFTDITDSHLAGITSLYLNGRNITSLKSGDFDGLTSLEELRLYGNQISSLPSDIFDGLSALETLNLFNNRLSSLPDGLFAGLTSLTTLRLNGNAVTPIPLTVSLEKIGTDQFKAVAPAGAPFEMVLPISVINGRIKEGSSSLTIPKGSVESGTLTVTRNADTTANVTVNIRTLPRLPSNHRGYALVKSTDLPLSYPLPEVHSLIGNRTPQVRDAIVAAVPGVNSANDVTEAHLAAITSLWLSDEDIETLKADDFNGLTALTVLDLSDNQLSKLPEGIFDELINLEWLYLDNNNLTTLPTDQFSNLTKLTALRLSNNALTNLPENIFNGLTALEQLWLGSNSLTDLPENIFSGLTALTELALSNNAFTTLPEGVFDGLTALGYLSLSNTKLTSLPDGIFEQLTFTDILLHNNAFTTLPEGIFDGLTGIRILWLQGNAVEPLPLNVSLEKVADGQFNAVVPAGAPFEIVLPISVTNGSINGGATSLTIPAGSVESETLTVTRTAGTTAAVTVDIGTLPSLPTNHQGYTLVKSVDLPLTVIGTSPTVITPTDTDTQVTGINIPDANLRAKIETALSKTAGDPITATEMATLTTLTAQDASISNLTGIETATNLTTLKLGNNTISNISALSGLTSLTELQLWDNQITNLSALSGLTNLIKLYLWGNNISDISHLSGLTSLTQLRLGENSVSNIAAVSSLRNLTYLSVKENAISDISAVSGLTNLTELLIGNNTISDITLVQNLTNLEWLDMPNNSISDISAVQNLTQLVELYFQNNAVSDLSPLVTNTGLGTDDEIDVRGNPLSYPSIWTHIPALQAKNVYVDFDNRVATAPVKISGDTQQGNTGATLTQPFVVEVQDASSVAFAGVPVTFAVTAGGGTLSATNTTTDVNGRAESTLTLGNTAGTNTVSVSVTGITQTITFTATATAPVVVYITPVGDRTSQVAEAILGVVRLDYPSVSSYAGITTTHLAAPTVLYLNNKSITALKSGDFDGLTGLEELRLNNNQLTSLSSDIFSGLTSLSNLNLYNNQLSSLPDGIFEGLTSLTKIRLGRNTVNPLPVTVSLEKVAEGQFKVIVPTGALFAITVPISVTNGSITSGASSVTIPKGGVESETLTVTRTAGTTTDVTVDIGTLPSLPRNHYGYALVKSDDLPLAVITSINTAPVFTDGTVVTRTVAENTAAATNIGTLIAATDADNDTLTYTLSGTDASAFDIDSSTGQLKTKGALDYETKNAYTVTITVSDGNLTDMIAVTINITDIDEVVTVDPPTTPDPPTTNTAPEFTDGSSTTRSVAENTASNVNIGTAVAATDADSDTLTYSLGGTDATTFSIDTATGQIKTLVALGFETKTSYTVTITVSDGNGAADSITVTINVTDVNEQQTSTTTYNVGDDITTLPSGFWTPDRTANGASFSLVGGQVTITFSNNGLIEEDDITYTCVAAGGCEIVNGQVTQGTIEATTDDIVTPTLPTPVTNSAPEFSEGTTAARSVAENTATGQNISTAVAATDVDGHTLTYTLSGTDASAFDIDSSTGQLKTKAALDYETKSTYTVTITVSDGSLTDTITVTINVTDINEVVTVDPPTTPDPLTTNTAPEFLEGDSTTRVVLENTAAGTNIGNPVNATDTAGDLLAYTLSGVNADAFDLDSDGQLKTKASLDYETKRVYSVTITVDDDELSDTITVIISVIDVNDTVVSAGFVPVADRTPQVRDAIVATVPNVTDAASVTESQVAAITSLNLRSKGISSLKIGDFSGMTALTNLNLFRNQLSELPSGIFDGLTALTTLRLGGNAVDPLPLIVSLQQVSSSEYRAVIATGAPFNIVLPINVTNGSISGGITSITIPQGSAESGSFTVIGTSAKVSFGTLPGLPSNHFGYTFAQSTVCNRTTEVADAIAKAVGVPDCSAVTEVDLATITRLDLSGSNITSLQSGDFDGMLSLTTLYLENNDLTSLPNGIFDDLASLNFLSLNDNKLTSLPSGIFSDLTSLTTLDVFNNDISSLQSGVFDGLSSLTTIDLNDNELTSLSGDIFDGLSALTYLKLSNNKLTTLSAGLFDRLTSLAQLQLNGNPVDPLPIVVSLQKVGTNQFKAVAPTGAPFAMTLPVTVQNGTIAGGATTITIPTGKVESQPLTVTRTPGTVNAVTANIGNQLPTLPATHNGYAFVKSTTLPVEVIPPLNSAPIFTEGVNTIRTVAENTAAGVNIGDVVAATDQDANTTLTYTLSGTDAASFDIDSTNGQLKTKSALDFETKNAYSVTLTVSDGLGTDTIAVTINISNVNEAPIFAANSPTTHTVPENTAAGENIGTAYSATDVDGDTLTFSLSGPDASAYDIDSSTGQLKTKAALDYETKTSYSITITASDDTLADTITVTINITDVDENIAPVFTEGSTATRSIVENTAANINIGTAVSATDADNDTLTYTLGGTDAAAFDIDGTTGQLKTKAALDYETKTSYSITITASDDTLADTITVTINITDIDENIAPVFTEGSTATRSIAENTASDVNIGTAVSATDADINTLTYTLGGTDAAAFDIDGTTGQLKTKASLDYETKTSYSVTITVSDGKATDSITVTINITDIDESVPNRAPVFTAGTSTTRSIAENTPAGANIGTAVSATDADGNTLSYKLSGRDASAFNIDNSIGQLKTKSALDYETKRVYSITITVSDGSLTDTINVTISVTDVEETIVIIDTDETRQDQEPDTQQDNTLMPDANLRAAVRTALELDDDDVLTEQAIDSLTSLSTYQSPISDLTGLEYATALTSLSLEFSQISDISPLKDLTQLTSLNLSYGLISDITSLQDLTNLTSLSLFGSYNNDNRISDITPLGSLTKLTSLDLRNNQISDITTLSNLTELTTLRLNQNQIGNVSALQNLVKLRTLNLSENLISDYAPLRTLKAQNPFVDIDITIPEVVQTTNNVPVFTDGNSTTRSIAENTAAGVNIGTAVSATDADNDTLTYNIVLDNTDAAAFSIDGATGQLKTKASLDYETQNSYSFRVFVSDGNGGNDSISVTINITDVVESGPISDRTTQVRDAIVAVIPGVDSHNNVTVTHLERITFLDLSNKSITSLKSGDFDNLSSLQTLRLNSNSFTSLPEDIFDDLSSLQSLGLSRTGLTSLPEDIFDGPSSLTSISFFDGALTSLPENVFDGLSSLESLELYGNELTSLPENLFDGLSALTSLRLSGNDLSSLLADVFDGLSSLESLNLASNGLSSLPADVFDGLSSLESLNLASNGLSSLPADIFDGLSSLESLNLMGNNLTSLPSGVFDDLSSLETLDLRNNSITDVSELEGLTSLTTLYLAGNSISDYAPLTALKQSNTNLSIDITIPGLVNNAPVFTEGESTTRSLNEAYYVDRSFGDPVSATDPDNDALTFTISGTDAEGTFGVYQNNGQLNLRSTAQLDYDTKSSYTVTITASDNKGGSDSITVTINLTQAPEFDDGTSTTRSIAEETAANVNIGDPVSATDAESDTLTYFIITTDHANVFSISSNGQLKTRTFLDYETLSSYTIKVRVWDSDGGGGFTEITVTINVTNVDESSTTLVSDRTEQVRDALVSATNKVASEITAEDLARILRLDLYGEGITSLRSGDFGGLVSLTYLNLGNNPFTSLPEDIFEGLSALTDLRIGNSDLTSLPEDIFDELSSLTELQISGTFTSLPSDLFDELSSLTKLWLTGDELTSIPEDLFDELSSLTELRLGGNKLTSIPEDLLDGLSSLKSFGLRGSALTSIPEDLFDGLSTLESIGFNWMQVSTLPEDLLDGLSSLKSFGLTQVFISSIPEDLFDGLSSLESVSLYYTSLGSIPEDLFDGLSSLKSVAIVDAGRSLTSLPEDLFDGLSSLESINLSDCELTSFPAGLFDGLSSLTSLSVSGNPIDDYGTLRTLKENYPDISIDITIPEEDNGAPALTSVPTTTSLLANFPNPFNPETWIPYELSKPAEVTLTIYNMRGQVIRQLKLGQMPAGVYRSRSRAIHWDGRNIIGEKVAAGVYFYTLTAGDFTATRKMLIRK